MVFSFFLLLFSLVSFLLTLISLFFFFGSTGWESLHCAVLGFGGAFSGYRFTVTQRGEPKKNRADDCACTRLFTLCVLLLTFDLLTYDHRGFFSPSLFYLHFFFSLSLGLGWAWSGRLGHQFAVRIISGALQADIWRTTSHHHIMDYSKACKGAFSDN